MIHYHGSIINKEKSIWDKRVYFTKWCWIQKTQIGGANWSPLLRMKKPPYEETLEFKLLNALKVTHFLVDDLNLNSYMRETEKVKQFFSTKSPTLYAIVKDKVLYIYLRVNQIVAIVL